MNINVWWSFSVKLFHVDVAKDSALSSPISGEFSNLVSELLLLSSEVEEKSLSIAVLYSLCSWYYDGNCQNLDLMICFLSLKKSRDLEDLRERITN